MSTASRRHGANRRVGPWDYWPPPIGRATGSAGISTDDPHAVYLRRMMKISKPLTRATAYICGLGYYELYLNGRRVGDHVLDPAFTDFDKRVMYVTFDVTGQLQTGPNALGVVLGNGWFHPITPDLFGFEKAPWRQPPPADQHRTILSCTETVPLAGSVVAG